MNNFETLNLQNLIKVTLFIVSSLSCIDLHSQNEKLFNVKIGQLSSVEVEYKYIFDELIDIIKDQINCKKEIYESEANVASKFNCQNNYITIEGDITSAFIEPTRKAKKKYKSIEREIILEQLENSLSFFGFKLLCSDKNQETFLYNLAIAQENTLFEIYFPSSPEEYIEFVLAREFTYESKPQPIIPKLLKKYEELEWCQSKCLIQDQYTSIKFRTYFEYVGYQENFEEVIEWEILDKPGGSKWVKRRDKNCKSQNPSDCLMWCLQESPTSYNKIFVVSDTLKNKDFIRTIVDRRILSETGGFTEWRKTLCETEISSDFVYKLKQILTTEGFYYGNNEELEYGADLKAALLKYQKENQLPVGQLDYETLAFLINNGMEYWDID